MFICSFGLFVCGLYLVLAFVLGYVQFTFRRGTSWEARAASLHDLLLFFEVNESRIGPIKKELTDCGFTSPISTIVSLSRLEFHLDKRQKCSVVFWTVWPSE